MLRGLVVARVFTREEFHELVWSKPMTHLAKEFAISDVALHKICRKHGIPNPPLGWWAKKAAGKRVQKARLPEAKPGDAERITIAGGNLSRESGVLVSVREQARILASDGDEEDAAPPHPIVQRTLAKLRKAKASDVGVVKVDGNGFIKCEAAVSSVDRLLVALPRIARAAARQGFDLVAGEGAAEFRSESETVGFSITESVRREKHTLTDAEQAKERAWQRKRDRVARGNSWDTLFFDKPRFPEWDYRPTGQLSFEFEHVYVLNGVAPRRRFRDAKIQRLENMAADIAIGLAVLAAVKTEQRLEREAQRKKFEEERRLRELAQRARHTEERRLAGLDEVLSELDKLDRLRRLISILTSEVSAGPTPRVSTFLEWAKEHLAEREASLLPNAVEKRFETERLFGDDDDDGFTPSGWY